MMPYLQIIRPINLLLIVYAQWLMRFKIVIPLVGLYELESKLPASVFWLFVISTVCIAAGGYVINDIMDYRIDMVNKPNRVWVRKHISETQASNLFTALYVIGLLSAVAGAHLLDMISLAFIFGIMAVLMYYYATSLKKSLLLGNLLVAFAIGMVLFTIGIIEITQINLAYKEEVLKNERATLFFQRTIQQVLYWIGGFSLFAFLITLTREITKDLADMKGDKRYGVSSLPLTIGIKYTKWVLAVLYGLIAGLILYLQQNFLFDDYSTVFLWLTAGFILAIIVINFGIKKDEHWLISANLNKALSAIGLSYAWLSAYIIEQL